MIVVGASVALLWAQAPHSDPRVRPALDLLPHLEAVVAPDLFAYEVAQVVHVKRPHDFGPDLPARTATVRDLLETVTLEPSDPKRVGRLAEAHGLTAYDAAYLELAERKDWPLVTEDAQLCAAGGIRVAEALERTRPRSDA